MRGGPAIDVVALSLPEFAARLAAPSALSEEAGALGGVVAVVDLGTDAPGAPSDAARRGARTVPGLIVGRGPVGLSPATTAWAELTDVVLPTSDGADPNDELERLLTFVATRPKAAAALALLLRTEHATVEDGLVGESAAYSMLQGGPEFAVWRAGRPLASPRADPGPPVRMARNGDRLVITLSRPDRHNALSAAMRDGLAEALVAGLADPMATVVLQGDGPSFCSGGDLDEFGTTPDPVTSHLIRLTRSPAALAARLGPRLECQVHGACLGAGIELAAFARRVVARPDAFFALPELALGLIPGSGGTVSLPRRIGRHRTAWLALTGERIDAVQAQAWGLVDEIG
jgi:hypothetical protein